MNLDFAAMQANIDACDAMTAASEAVLDSMTRCLFETTSGSAIETKPHTEPNAAKWPLCIATDDERANGRLAWVPGL